jgi:hypothetical protein
MRAYRVSRYGSKSVGSYTLQVRGAIIAADLQEETLLCAPPGMEERLHVASLHTKVASLLYRLVACLA